MKFTDLWSSDTSGEMMFHKTGTTTEKALSPASLVEDCMKQCKMKDP